MKKTEDLRLEADKLQKKIDDLIRLFINNNGACSIVINCEPTYVITTKKMLVNSNVTVDITI